MPATAGGGHGAHPKARQSDEATRSSVVGAAGGALINTLFIDHFQDMARGHFVVRRLERVYGTDAVRAAYEISSVPGPAAD